MKDFNTPTVGIKKPATPEAQAIITSDVREMRKAINRAQRHSQVVNMALNMAHHLGLSGEETMVVIAYYALTQAQDYFEHAMNITALHPAVIFKDDAHGR